MRAIWVLLVLAACANSTPPQRDEVASEPSHAATPPSPSTPGTSAASPGGGSVPASVSPPSTATPATGVVSNDGIRAFDALTAAQLEPLKQRRVLWGHQSVGENLIEGARSLGFDFRTVSRDDDYGEAHWGEAPVAENGDPARKIHSFVELMVGGGIGRRVEAAAFKFCWVDFEDGTDVEELADDYDATIRDMQARFPSVRFLHVTPPLTTDEPELNGIRWRYGRTLLQRHRDTGVVFDLAAVISTDAAGQQCKSGNQRRLCPAWSSDSGHLNEAGRQRAAKAFLYAFYKLFS